VRVLLDTNVLVSTFTTRGICADILREVLLHKELIVCPLLLDEVTSVLTTKFNLPDDLVATISDFLQQGTLFIEKSVVVKANISDKNDILLLGYSLSGKAEVFVTGDRELQRLKKVKNLKLLSPREYWDFVRKSQ
jgi:putative PIN family toxin of toxin-antitoxin system